MSYSAAVPRTLQDADPELEKLVLVGDKALEDLKPRITTDQYFDIAHMPDWVVDAWLKAFGWPYKWVDPADKRLLLKLLPIIYKEGGTNNGIILISQAFGGSKDKPILLEPIVYCQPLSEMNGLSTEYATFCDDFYYNSLTLDIELPLGVKSNLKEILAIMKAAWVRYRYTFRCRESAAAPAAVSLGRTLSLYPGVRRWWHEAGLSCGEELSGGQLHFPGQRAIFRAYRADDHLYNDWSEGPENPDGWIVYPGPSAGASLSDAGSLSDDGMVSGVHHHPGRLSPAPYRRSKGRVLPHLDMEGLVAVAASMGLVVVPRLLHLAQLSGGQGLSDGAGELEPRLAGELMPTSDLDGFEPIRAEVEKWLTIPTNLARKVWHVHSRARSQGLSSGSGATDSAFGYGSKAEPLASLEAPTSGAGIGLSLAAKDERSPWFSPVGWFDPGKSLVDALTFQACAVTQMP